MLRPLFLLSERTEANRMVMGDDTTSRVRQEGQWTRIRLAIEI
jgi:hypothetical protein